MFRFSPPKPSLWLTLLAVSAAITIPAKAQDTAAELYGYGVHAYNSNLHSEAFDLLSQSIAHNAKDPRPYYYRGLAQSVLGRSDEATADFQKAAELEVMNTKQNFNVSVALERVQGPIRLEIENIRRKTRIAMITRKRAADQAKYARFQAAEANALIDPDKAIEEPKLADDLPEDPNDPFADGADAVAGTDEGTGTDPFNAVASDDGDANTDAVEDTTADAADNTVAGSDDGEAGTTGAVDPFAIPADDADNAATDNAVAGNTADDNTGTAGAVDPFALPSDNTGGADAGGADTTTDGTSGAVDPFALPSDNAASSDNAGNNNPPVNNVDPFALPSDTTTDGPDTPTENPSPAPSGDRRGALGGIFRAFGRHLPSNPMMGEADFSEEFEGFEDFDEKDMGDAYDEMMERDTRPGNPAAPGFDPFAE